MGTLRRRVQSPPLDHLNEREHRGLIARALSVLIEEDAFMGSAEVDFGSTPVESASFTVTDPRVRTGMHVMAQVAYEAPTGKDLDEVEMDALDLKATAGDGSFTLFAKGLDGYVADKFVIAYTAGA